MLVIALLTLPLSIATGWGEPPTSGYAFWLLGLFAVSIGLPFFALAANNPLLQAWFVRTGHPNGPDPYFLYASSNIGSFLALLSYPVLLEPMFTLRTQNLIWTGLYGLLILLIAGCGVLLLRSPANVVVEQSDDADAPAPPWALRLRWIFLAAVPSGLLIAVTAHISTDVAAAPLLWVLPLSLYLLTWVLVFQSRPLLPHKWVLMLQPLAIAGVIVLLAVGGEQNLLLTLGGHLLCFFVIAMACHGELARTRPGLEISHRLLCCAVVRRHGRRTVRGADRALHILLDRGISDPGRACGVVPSAGGRAVAAMEPLVLAAARRRRGGADRAVL